MKRKNILRTSILPLMVFAALTFINVQPQKENGKNEKAQGQPGNKGKNEEAKGKDNSKGNAQAQGNNQGKGNTAHGQGKDNSNQGQKNNNKPGSGGQGNNKSDNHGQGNSKANDHGKGNPDIGNGNDRSGNGKIKFGKGKSAVLNGKRDVELNWGLEDFGNRKRPGNQKKVTICHNAGGQGSNPVTINISENAVQAHINHGDQMGNCTINYSDRWSENYIRSRENVYNVYEQTWETMSYSEALLRLAAEKLLGIRSDLSRTRPTLTSQEIQRREALIYELQNNVNSLENQLGITQQRLDSDVNIIIQL